MKKAETVEGFFDDHPQLLPLFENFAQKVQHQHPETFIKVQKTQIGFCDPKAYCWVWLPIRAGISGRPESYLVVSFGLNHQVHHPRLIDAVEPYPNRWTHHTIVSREEELDMELMGWIREAHDWKKGVAKHSNVGGQDDE